MAERRNKGKFLRRTLDAVLGRVLRHVIYLFVRPYYGLFFNISCSNKHLLQDLPGGLILASHVSRHDGPMISAVLYPTKRVRPAAHYSEYYNWLQWFPMMLVGTIPMSSPKHWPPERRARRKIWSLDIIERVIRNGHLVLLFPGGQVKRQPEEIIDPRFSGAHDILQAIPDCPVVLLRTEGMSKFETPIHDKFWSFLFIPKGRRHVNIHLDVRPSGLDATMPRAEFNQMLENYFNGRP